MQTLYSYKAAKDYLLVAAVKNGNEKAYTELYARYYSTIKNKLLYNNTISKQDAEDITVESFLDFFELILSGKYKDENKISSYIYKIAYRKFLKKIRGEKFKNTKEINETFLREIYNDESEQEIYFNAADKSIKLLSEICKELILLKYFNKYSDKEFFYEHPELKNVQNVKRKRNRCMEKLRKNANNYLKEN